MKVFDKSYDGVDIVVDANASTTTITITIDNSTVESALLAALSQLVPSLGGVPGIIASAFGGTAMKAAPVVAEAAKSAAAAVAPAAAKVEESVKQDAEKVGRVLTDAEKEVLAKAGLL